MARKKSSLQSENTVEEKPKRFWPQFTWRTIRKTLGNIFMALGLGLLLLIYLPVLKAYLPIKPPQNPDLSFSISIPEINAYAPLVDNVDPWNETEYRQALEKGVAVAKGFSKPGEKGTVYIFAHSSDSPWRITSYNTVFFRLGELNQGDIIELISEGKTHKYAVSHSIEVWPNEVKAVTESKSDQLILQTCTPIGTSLKRLLVFADPVLDDREQVEELNKESPR